MATIKKQGRGYKITVSQGYDIKGKQIRTHMTWVPDPGMTPRQLEKELNRQAVLFEEQIRAAGVKNGKIRLVDFSEIFLRDHAVPNLKKKTAYDYRQKLEIINKGLGHIKLQDLRPGHIASFYSNMKEKGMRIRTLATAKDTFPALFSARGAITALSRKSGVSISTIRRTRTGLPIEKATAQVLADSLGVSASEYFVFTRDTSPLSPGTLRTIHRVLSAVLGRAVAWGYLKDNPAERVSTPSQKKREASYLDEEDARRLLELLAQEPIRWRAPVAFDLLSGLRRGELLGLRWQDVDEDKQMIYICQTQNYTPADGTYTDTPKNITSNRPLRVARSAFFLLAEYKVWQDAQREKLGDAWEDQDGRIFTNSFGAPLHPDSITKWFHSFVQRTGLPKVTVHSLRHTYASLMIFDGINLVTVSHQLGHAQTSTTTNIYAHVIASAEAMAAESSSRFDDVILGNKHQTNTKTIKAS